MGNDHRHNSAARPSYTGSWLSIACTAFFILLFLTPCFAGGRNCLITVWVMDRAGNRSNVDTLCVPCDSLKGGDLLHAVQRWKQAERREADFQAQTLQTETGEVTPHSLAGVGVAEGARETPDSVKASGNKSAVKRAAR